MENKTLKDFYYGNLTPGERQTVRGAEAAHVAQEIADTDAKLRKILVGNEINLLDKLNAAQSWFNSVAIVDSYIDGFKTGARFILEILDNSRENFKPIIE